MESHTVLMTPQTCGNIKTIKVERNGLIDVTQMHHEGTGHLKGIIINKESVELEQTICPQEMQLEFTCLMRNMRTEEPHWENRRLKFWFIEGTEHSQRLADSYDFFKDLVNQGSFPKDYVGFIKRMLQQLQSVLYPNLRRVDLDIVPLETWQQEALVPEKEEKPLQILVREGILKTLEDAYPNVLSVDDLIRITDTEDYPVLQKELQELHKNDLIQPVCIETSPVKKMGYRRKLQVLHKVEEIRGTNTMKTISNEQKPTVAIITNLLCEKLAIDSFIERKTTYIRYKTEGDSNVYTIGFIGSIKVISVKLPMVGWELQAKISSGSITTRLLGVFQSIQHVILVGVAGGVPHVYEFEKHSRLGDVVISAASPATLHSSKTSDQNGHATVTTNQPIYVFCERTVELQNGLSSLAHHHKSPPILFSHKNFASKNSDLLDGAQAVTNELKQLSEKCSWYQFIDDGLGNLKDHEFDFSRPPANTDKLKIQIGDEMTVDVKHPRATDSSNVVSIPGSPTARFGCIGSGRQITDSHLLREMFARDQHVLAFDAEFDQVLESLLGNGITSFLIVRGISDYVEGRQASDVSWQPYAALVAAAFTKALLLKLGENELQ